MDIEEIAADANKVIPGRWRSEPDPFLPLQQNCNNRCTRDSKAIQEEFVQYFNSLQGAVPWQWATVA